MIITTMVINNHRCNRGSYGSQILAPLQSSARCFSQVSLIPVSGANRLSLFVLSSSGKPGIMPTSLLPASLGVALNTQHSPHIVLLVSLPVFSTRLCLTRVLSHGVGLVPGAYAYIGKCLYVNKWLSTFQQMSLKGNPCLPMRPG